MNNVRYLLLFLVIFLLSACGAHVSPLATETSRATIKSEVDLCFTKLDAKELTFLGLWPSHELVVEPGTHTVIIKYQNKSYVPYNANWTITYTSYHTLSFRVENNHIYLARGVQRGDKHYVWVEDQTANTVVAGHRPQ